MQKMIIAIDGYAATGKSSLAKRLAKTLQFKYIDTGAMYRAITYFALQQEPKGSVHEKQLIAALDQIKLHFELTTSGQEVSLNGVNINKEIRQSDVTSEVSNVAKIPEVRAVLVAQQQAMGIEKGIIMDGRDIGTVVFPNAECKFFLTATPEVRAKRRHLEQMDQGIHESYEDVLDNIQTRDLIDSTRETAPLRKASDAIEIDVSEMTLEEVYQKIWSYILKKQSKTS